MQALQDVEARDGMWPGEFLRVRRRRDIAHPDQVVGRAERRQSAIDGGQALLRNLPVELPPQVQLAAWPELVCGQFLGSQAQGLREIRSVNSKLSVSGVDAADDQVHVGIVSVVVANGGPAQPTPEILFHPLDQSPCVVLQVQLIPGLGRDDEPKLPFLPLDRCPEFGATDLSIGVEQAPLCRRPRVSVEK